MDLWYQLLSTFNFCLYWDSTSTWHKFKTQHYVHLKVAHYTEIWYVPHDTDLTTVCDLYFRHFLIRQLWNKRHGRRVEKSTFMVLTKFACITGIINAAWCTGNVCTSVFWYEPCIWYARAYFTINVIKFNICSYYTSMMQSNFHAVYIIVHQLSYKQYVKM
jgi:hypothetical protein